MNFVGNLLLFAAVKEFCILIKTDKVIAMVRVAPFFDSRCMLWPNGWMDQDATW